MELHTVVLAQDFPVTCLETSYKSYLLILNNNTYGCYGGCYGNTKINIEKSRKMSFFQVKLSDYQHEFYYPIVDNDFQLAWILSYQNLVVYRLASGAYGCYGRCHGNT